MSRKEEILYNNLNKKMFLGNISGDKVNLWKGLYDSILEAMEQYKNEEVHKVCEIYEYQKNNRNMKNICKIMDIDYDGLQIWLEKSYEELKELSKEKKDES